MLDKISFCLLKRINALCDGGTYKVLCFDDLCLLPPLKGLSDSEIYNAIKRLSEAEYVSVKYIDVQQVCLCVLAKGRCASKHRIILKPQTTKDNKVFAYAMLGGLTGGVLAMAIAILIYVLGGLSA